jgi:CheY-like chemotaxis protein
VRRMEVDEFATDRQILIVDDDPDTCELLSLIFIKQGFQTIVAKSGPEALAVIENQNPDVCVLDVMMPGMDGWEAFERIRTLSNIPVLFLTAVTSGQSAARALDIGVNDYVRKPFNPDELVARTQALLRFTRSTPVYPTLNPSVVTRPSVSVIIPTLNEAENLPLVLPFLPFEWLDEVILVDGNSTDGTIQVAKRLLPSIKIVVEEKEGKGAAIIAGYHAAQGDIAIVLDADGSHDPREIPKFVMALMEGADLAKGSRFAPGGGTTDMPRFRQFGNYFFVLLTNLFFNVHFTDLCYGYHACWRYCLDAISLDQIDGFEIDTALYLQALQHQLRLVEVPSFEGYRFRGLGKLRTFPDGWRVLMTILRETKRHYFSPNKTQYEGFRGNAPEEIQLPETSVVEEANLE